jgi:hypothetical protein
MRAPQPWNKYTQELHQKQPKGVMNLSNRRKLNSNQAHAKLSIQLLRNSNDLAALLPGG